MTRDNEAREGPDVRQEAKGGREGEYRPRSRLAMGENADGVLVPPRSCDSIYTWQTRVSMRETVHDSMVEWQYS